MRIVALALLLAAALAAPAAAAPKEPLRTEGRWVTDAEGRVWITHGVNMVYKRKPYVPAETGFGRDDARFLRRHGFNSVRLGTIYAGVEPARGSYDRAYLRRVRSTARVLARAGVFTQVDFHQDLYNERFGGEGFPDWAVLDDGVPAEPLSGFPLTYITSPGGNRAWQSFWENREGLWDAFAAAWRETARVFRGEDRLLGYDLLNEPWPGPEWTTCANTEGCRAFEEGPLAGMQARAMLAIREVDRRNLIWYEPVVTSQFGTKYWVPNPTRDRRGALSFHTYCLPGGVGPPGAPACEEGEQLSIDNALARAVANDDPLLLSEWGATDDLDVIHRMADRADRSMVPWQWWHYCACDDPTTAGPGDVQALVSDPAKPPRGDNVLEDKLRAVSRPYPQLIAGTPRSWSFDRETREFRAEWSTARAGGGPRFGRRAVSDVFLGRLHYPRGYRVQVRGARRVSQRGARVLRLRTRRGAERVTLRVRPRG